MARPRSVEIYLQEGIPEDDYIHDVSRRMVSLGRGRRQAMFRRALLIGLSTILGPDEGFSRTPRPKRPRHVEPVGIPEDEVLSLEDVIATTDEARDSGRPEEKSEEMSDVQVVDRTGVVEKPARRLRPIM